MLAIRPLGYPCVTPFVTVHIYVERGSDLQHPSKKDTMSLPVLLLNTMFSLNNGKIIFAFNLIKSRLATYMACLST